MSNKLIQRTTLARANNALRGHLYSEAIELYNLALKEHPELKDAITFNIDFAVNRISTSVANQPQNTISDAGDVVTSPTITPSSLNNPDYAQKLAVVVHLYYLHLWPQISQYLLNLTQDFRLIITHPRHLADAVKKITKDQYPDATLVPVDNVGMDVLPFLKVVKLFKLWTYDAVLKLHTKNDKTEDKQIQGRMLLDGVLGSKLAVTKILKLLNSDSKIGLIGSELLFRSGDLLMYNNRALYEKLMSSLNLRTNGAPFGFIAGTTFWIKGKMLTHFDLNYHEIEQLFSADVSAKTGGDGTYAHAMERVFGAIPVSLGYKSAVSYPAALEPLEYDLKIVSGNRIDSNPIYKTGSGSHVVRYKHLAAIANSIRKSSLFDPSYYISQLPPGSITNEDPVIHYILHSELFTANPSPSFDEQYYLVRYKDISRTRSPALIHYINHGRREKRNSMPTDVDWIALGVKEGLIEAKWTGREQELAVILKHGSPQQCVDAYTKNYNPYDIPQLSYFAKKHSALAVLKTYLMVIFHEELQEYDLLERCGRTAIIKMLKA